jgi:AcrR family transcriptional regulator
VLAANLQTPASQQRIQQIIDATIAVMGRQSYAGTSMKDIAREAGVAQGLIHYYFGSKEDLVLAALRQTCDLMIDETRRRFTETTGDPLTRAWAAIQGARDHCAAHPELFSLMFELVPQAANNPALSTALKEMYAHLTDESEAMVHELCEMLPTPLPVPEREMAAIIVAAIDGLALRSLVMQDESTPGLYRALGFLLLSSGAASYAAAGMEMPPLEQMMDLLDQQAAPPDPGPRLPDEAV